MGESFEEIRDGDVLWRFDTQFLASNWTCIWGRGCLGIAPDPAPDLGLGCCELALVWLSPSIERVGKVYGWFEESVFGGV